MHTHSKNCGNLNIGITSFPATLLLPHLRVFMKKIVLAVAIAASFVAAPVFAQGYVGLGVGSASATGVDGSRGIAPFSVTGGNSSKGFVKIFGGYQFSPNWGVEAQYADMGNRDIALRNGAGVSVATGSLKFSQFSIAGTGTLPLGANFSLFGKLGASSNTAKGSLVGVTDSDSTTSLMLGIGAAYSISKQISVRVEYENFGKLAKDDGFGGAVRGNAYSVGLKYAF